MYGYLPSYILKQRAREQLSKNLGTVIGAFLLHLLCALPVMLLLTYIPSDTFVMMIVLFIAEVIWEIYMSVFLAGENLIALSVSVNAPAQIMDVFSGFKNNLLRIIGIAVIPATIKTLMAMPFSLAYEKFVECSNQYDMNEFLTLYMKGDYEGAMAIIEPVIPLEMMVLLLGVIYLIVCEIVKIMFSQTLFMIHDYPDRSAMDIVRLSLKAMKGSWGRYLYLQLSFILWDVMSFFTCGLSMLWVYPYKRMTYAEFYLDLMKGYGSTHGA